MELWNKLFTNRKKTDQNKAQRTLSATQRSVECGGLSGVGAAAGPGSHASGNLVQGHLERAGVRVLVYRECDTRGRKLLYDSQTVVRVPLPPDPVTSSPSATSSVVAASCRTLFKTTWAAPALAAATSPALQTSNSSSTNRFGGTNVKASGGAAPSHKGDNFVEMTAGYGYQYLKAEADTKQIGEYVFGTVAMAYRGSCTKLHLLENPERVLLSRTSPAPRSYLRSSCASSDQGIEDSSYSSSISSMSEPVTSSHMDSLDMSTITGGTGGLTWSMEMPHMLSTSHSEGDSGFGGPPSPYASTCGSFLSPPSLPNTPYGTPSSRQGSGNSLKNSGSLNSLQRRFLRNVTTSLEALSREGEVCDDGGTSTVHPSHRVTKLGVAVTIDIRRSHSELERQLKEWLFLHLGIIEGSISKLQACLDNAYVHPRTFVSTTHQVVAQFQQDVLDLMNGPRLSRPVWLGLLGKSSTTERQALCCSFVNTLASVLTTFDTKQTNFFVSKLLTGVLTHHLGWVSTVAPGDSGVAAPSLPHDNSNSTQPTSWVENLNESHSYNAVWAQLCELSGAVGYPPRTSRTLLIGSDANLLSQLLTILSYIIRCSQVLERSIQPLELSDGIGPESTQSCFSRTASVASVVTIVEGSSKDVLRDSQQLSQTRHSSSAQLHRESSIRRSWRMNRENRNSRLFAPEFRNGNGEAAVEEHHGVSKADAEVGAAGVNLHNVKKDIDITSKWMLNDDVEIVINSPTSQNEPRISQHHSVKTDSESTGQHDLVTSSCNYEKTLSKSKTIVDLSMLADSSTDSSPSESHYSNFTKAKTFREPSVERLYPSLHHLDDHRETFGPVPLEPDIIAEKVQKLFRVSSKCNVPEKPSQENNIGYPPDSEIRYANRGSNISLSSSTRRSNSIGGSLPGDDPVVTVSVEESFDSKTNNVGKYSDIETVNTVRKSRSPNEVTVPAKDIQPEIEEGGKVLFLLGENDRLESLKTVDKTEEKSGLDLVADNVACTSYAFKDTNPIGFERFLSLGNRLESESNSKVGLIKLLPSPVDRRKFTRVRNVGRESAHDLTSLEREKVTYPLLSDLKQDQNILRGTDSEYHKHKDLIRKHCRHHSDPTNGVFMSKSMLNPSTEVLKGVVEEHVSDQREPLEENKSNKGSKSANTNLKGPTEDTRPGVDELEATSNTNVDVSKNSSGSPASDVSENCSLEDRVANSNDKPVLIPVPRCRCVSPNRSSCSPTVSGSPRGNSSLAESLLGGVLDHYSSVFVLHATTQTTHWEDNLRQDLSVAAHNSTLDQQVAEAIALVANTDTWEVQVVSSHSYIVERCGAGGQVGQRVGMSPLVSAITDSLLDLTRMGVQPQFIIQHLEERLCELYMKSQLLAEYMLGGTSASKEGSETSFIPYHLTDLTRALGLDLNDLPLLLAVASTHTPALTRMFGLSIR